AVPDKAAHLRKSFPRITVFDCAVGDHDGEVLFADDPGAPGCSSLAVHAAHDRASELRKFHVPLRRIDSLSLDQHQIDVIKMDIEGAELAALHGAESLIARCRPLILFESGPHENESDEVDLRALFAWFTDHQYQVLIPSRLPHEGPGLTEDGFVESHYYPFRTLDYFAVPAERRELFRDRARAVVGL
ncbi:MAG: FkbM family methyltransferase, partial [Planctomycetales bacterium]|nr:FkbM family methyltransferase [Planctomycetales bacterium]